VQVLDQQRKQCRVRFAIAHQLTAQFEAVEQKPSAFRDFG
jgi:hypothetical protein